MCNSGFNALETLETLVQQSSLRFEQEKNFLEDWSNRAELLGEYKVAELLSQAAFELGRSVSTLKELKVASNLHTLPEPTVLRC